MSDELQHYSQRGRPGSPMIMEHNRNVYGSIPVGDLSCISPPWFPVCFYTNPSNRGENVHKKPSNFKKKKKKSLTVRAALVIVLQISTGKTYCVVW